MLHESPTDCASLGTTAVEPAPTWVDHQLNGSRPSSSMTAAIETEASSSGFESFTPEQIWGYFHQVYQNQNFNKSKLHWNKCIWPRVCVKSISASHRPCWVRTKMTMTGSAAPQRSRNVKYSELCPLMLAGEPNFNCLLWRSELCQRVKRRWGEFSKLFQIFRDRC